MTLALLAVLAVSCQDDVTRLTRGVTALPVHGAPGPVVAFTEQAFPVFVGTSGDHETFLAVASRLGRGRVLAFGHTGYLGAPKDGAVPMMDNALAWLANKRTVAQVRVGVHQGRGLRRYLSGKGVTSVDADLSRLQEIDVLVISAFALRSDESEKAVAGFVLGGGGLMTAATGWAYTTYIEKGRDLALDFRGNRLLRPAGIAFTTEGMKAAGKAGFFPAKPEPSRSHAGHALDLLEKSIRSGAPLPPRDLPGITASLTLAMRSLPPEGNPFADRLPGLFGDADAIPTAKRPVRDRETARWMAVTWSTLLARQAPIESIKAHPAAASFPGAVPADAPRITARVKVDTAVPRWHSTGLYAAPGEILTVLVPKPDAGLKLRIGAHKDGLWRKTSWKRCPEITRSFPLDAATVRGACAFGGPVYIEVPRNAGSGTVELRIANAVQAPLYIHGRTSLADWRTVQRNHPAPWAEIGSDKWVMTVPSELVRSLDDPKTLMDTWDRGLDLVAEMAIIPKDRPSAERIVFDVQISAGFMHSGYPIMAHVPQAGDALKPERVRDPHPAWGFWHELGHNHQHRDWTFNGTGEVTCNLFALYVGEKLGGIPPSKVKRTSREAREKHLRRHYAKGPNFETWKSQPFLALAMYVQLQQEFGWEPFLDLFKEYRGLAKGERPKTDDEKRDQWMVRFSKRVGRNLGPFFEAWGVPTSAEARRSVQTLPSWMPEEMKPYLRSGN